MKRSSLRDLTHTAARRIVVAVIGTTLLGVGLVLVVTPGPAIVVLALALAVFALEFTWARRWLRKLKRVAREAAVDGTVTAKDTDRRKDGSREFRA